MKVGSLQASQGMKMLVGNNNNDSKGTSSWKEVLGQEAAKINPLHSVNEARNSSIKEAIKTGDWSKYHASQAKQHPAWYNEVNGEFVRNKVYYGQLIDSRVESLKEAKQSGDNKEIEKWQSILDITIEDFKKAPGEIPHVVAFANNSELAQEHGIGEPSNEWYDSKYNNPLVASQGRFQQQAWYENQHFADNPDDLKVALNAVKDKDEKVAQLAKEMNQTEKAAVKEEQTAKPVSAAPEKVSIRDLQAQTPVTPLVQQKEENSIRASAFDFLYEQLEKKSGLLREKVGILDS